MRTSSRRQHTPPQPTESTSTSSSTSCQIRPPSNMDEGDSYNQSYIGEKFHQMEEEDTTGFLHFMDEQVHDTWDSAKAVVIGAQRLLHIHELPKEWQENEYVLSG